MCEDSFVRECTWAGGVADISARSGLIVFLRTHRLAQVLVERAEEILRVQERGVLADQQGEVLGHLPALDGPHADVLQRAGERGDPGRAVELAAALQAPGPGEDRGDRVGRGGLALLVLAVVAGGGGGGGGPPPPSALGGGPPPT